MGQGAHQGSAPGKNLCTLPHSLSCQGGIAENESWRACPTGYVFHAQVIPESGFVNTMNMTDFMSSTPIFGQTQLGVQSLLVPRLQHLVPGSPSHILPTTHQLPAISVQADEFLAQQQQIAQAIAVAQAAKSYYEQQMDLQAQASPGQTPTATSGTGQTAAPVPSSVIHQPASGIHNQSQLSTSLQQLTHHSLP
jgi:hypothetical protein